jgi:hypothetical protein
MQRLFTWAIGGFLVAVLAYFALATLLAVGAPSNRFPMIRDLTNPLALWIGGIGTAIGITISLFAQSGRAK